MKAVVEPAGWAGTRSLPMMVIGLLLMFLCSVSPASQPPRVLVSIKPVHSLVAGLMSGVGQPGLLIDGPVAPWAFKPNRSQLEAIEAADLIIWTGPELEPGLSPVLGQSRNETLVLEVLANEELKILPARYDDRRRDPFFWLDSRNMLILLDALAGVLSEMDPDRAQAYERNRHRMLESIAELDRVMEYGYRDVSGVPVFFYHDTHQYFEQAYAMNVAATVSDPVEPGEGATARLLELRSLLSETDDYCLFTERGLKTPHLQLALGGSAVEPIQLDVLGIDLPAGPNLYVELMRRNFEQIAGCVRALKPREAETQEDTESPDVRRFPDQVTPRYLMRDQFGRTVSAADFAGRFQLIYFGYTYCPDVCPTSLAIMAQALRQLGDLEDQVQPIFITVDPVRDTPAVLGEYVAYFHPRMLGLSTSPAATKRTAELFKARYQKVPAEDGDPSGYTMDHTSSLFLLGRNGEFITKFAHGLPAPDVAAKLRAYLTD